MDSEPQSPRSPVSPDRSLQQLLPTRSKNTGKYSPSRLSVASSDDRSALRTSIDRSIDKLKDRRRGSSDSDRRSSPDSSKRKRLANFVKKRPRNKISKSRSPGAGNTPDSSPRLGMLDEDSSKLNINSINASTDSLGRPNKSGGSSLLTEDSEPEATSPVRPTLSSRPSHTGILTFTSPLIATETVDTSDSAIEPIKSSEQPDQDSALSTLSEETSSAPKQLSSTGEKRRGVFSKSPSPKTGSGTESDPTKSGGGPVLGGLFGTSKKGGIKSEPDQENIVSPQPRAAQASLRSLSTNSLTSSEPPSTIVTPPSPIVPQKAAASRRSTKSNLSTGSIAPETISDLASETTTSLKHRRARSASVAKTATLPPTLEELKTPDGSLVSPPQNNFFSSFFSATQNTFAQISNTIANQSNANSRSRSGTDPGASASNGNPGGEEVILTKPNKTLNGTTREPAMATLGTGNLSLSHLGITDPSTDPSPMSSKTELVDDQNALSSTLQNGRASPGEEMNAADAISAAYAEKPASQKSVPVVNDTVNGMRPRSEGSAKGTNDEISPPRSLAADSLHRAGSVRSRLSRPKKKRGRGSTAGSGGAIAAALVASHGTIAAPARRTTGFDLANPKRNKEFHNIFKSVPESDHLIEDYSAALQRDILLHGRLYISEKHICFSSNILGWVTNLVISFDEVISMEKKSTAVIFPNAIVIQTLHAKNVFASFISRDPTYDLLIGIWKVGHPNLKSSLNGYALDNSGTGDKVEVAAEETETDESEDATDEDEGEDEVDDNGSVLRTSSILPGDPVDLPRDPTQRAPTIGGASINSPSVPEPTTTGGTAFSDLLGPLAHAPTECSDQATHYDKPLLDTIIQAPLGKVYSMMFGPASGAIMRKFLIDDQKCTEVQYEDDKRGMDQDVKTFSYQYIKPLNASFGPKQTLCITNQTLDVFDLEKAVSCTLSTQTPDVPSGNVFVTKTRYCLMWGPNNTTRFIGSCTCEWSGKSWLKGPIEKGAGDGQMQYGKDILEFLNKQLAAGRSPAKAPKGKVKGKKKRTSPSSSNLEVGSVKSNSAVSKTTQSNWGPFEPLHTILGPIGDILSPLLSATSVLGVLLGIMTMLWLRQSWPGTGPALGTNPAAITTSPHRAAAYEELWRREESHLWDWLEDRISLDEIPISSNRHRGQQSKHKLKPSAGATSLGAEGAMVDKLGEERMSERQVDDAIRVTEEKLAALKAAVERRKGARRKQTQKQS